MTMVVDASFAGSWILPDEHSGESETVLQSVLNGKEDMAATDLWAYEMLNLLLSACRRGRVRIDQLEGALQRLDSDGCTINSLKGNHLSSFWHHGS